MKPYDVFQGVYVHTPFCLRKCLYCDFPSYAGCPAALQERYVEALCREIRNPALSYWKKPVAPEATVYFGGGTPTVLSARQLGRVVAALKEAGWWRHPAEATIEANPGTVDPAKLQALRELGFDRLSLGVQSFQDGELQAIGRIHTASQAVQALQWAKEAGFRRLSVDLMYGLPGQTRDSFRQSLDQALSLGLEHISAYSLIVEEGTPLERLVREGRTTLPDDDATGAMYDDVTHILAAAGLARYEVSNYAVPGQESRHNEVYWHYLPYAAFGAAACGFDGSLRKTNTAGVEGYVRAMEEGQAGTVWQIEELPPATRLEEAVFMGLRTTRGVSLADLDERFGTNVSSIYKKEMGDLTRKGMVEIRQGRMRLTPFGMRYGNEAFEAFIRTGED